MKSKSKPCYAAKGLPKVPGKPKGTDIIPAWLTPGEAVLSPGAAEMLGRGNVQALNRQANHMRLGSQYKAMGDENMQPEEMQEPDYGAMGNQRADEILSNPDQFSPQEVRMAKMYMDPRGLAGGPSLDRDMQFLQGTRGLDQLNQDEEPQYFMGGTGMVLGQRPRYYAGGVNELFAEDEKKRNLYQDMPTIIDKPPQNLPAGYQAGQQFTNYLKGERAQDRDAFRLATEPFMTGARSLAESANRVGQGVEYLGNATMTGAKNLYNAQGNFMRGALGMEPPKPSQDGGIIKQANAEANPMNGNVMGPPKPAPSMLGTKSPMTADQAQSFINDPNRQVGVVSKGGLLPNNGYDVFDSPNNGKLLVSTVQSTPEEVSRFKAVNAPLDAAYRRGGNAIYNAAPTQAQIDARGPLDSSSKLGNAITRPTQPIQQMTQNTASLGNQTGPTSVTPMYGTAKFGTAQLGSESPWKNGYQPSEFEKNAFEEFRVRQYELMNQLKNSFNPDRIRAAGQAMEGQFNYNPGFAGAEASKFNTSADYNAKMNELGSGQGLRDSQSQEALARAQNYMSDTNLQNAMAQNPERFAGMRLGGRGVSGRAGSGKGGFTIKDYNDQPYAVSENGAVPIPMLPSFEQFTQENPNIPEAERQKKFMTLRQRMLESMRNQPGVMQQYIGGIQE